eukprot:scaffold1809_cov111-Isochrysis_galbana.AAC.2
MKAAAGPPVSARRLGGWGEPVAGMGALFIAAGAWRRLALALAALLEAWGFRGVAGAGCGLAADKGTVHGAGGGAEMSRMFRVVAADFKIVYIY